MMKMVFVNLLIHRAGWQMARLVGLVALISVLSGCVGAPPAISRYQLPQAAPAPVAEAGPEASVLVIEPISLASYLGGDGIVMQLSDIELNRADHHLWAEGLDRQLEQRLRRYLEQELDNTRVLLDPASASAAADRRLRVRVDQFQGRYDGEAVVSGEWFVLDGAGKLLSGDRFRVTRSLEADGYPALVRALGAAWGEIASRIGSNL